MNENSIQDTDVVLVRLTLRGRDSASTVTLNETVSVADLGLKAGGGVEPPTFDVVTFSKVIQVDPEEAMRMQAEFADATADYLASGQTTSSDDLASAVVQWVLSSRPQGHVYTTSDTSDGYVISEDAINIVGPVLVGDERLWRVTAVGTWGC